MSAYIARWIAQTHRRCAITPYDLAHATVAHYLDGTANIRDGYEKKFPTPAQLRRLREDLTVAGVIEPLPNAYANVVAFSPEDSIDVACAVDPTCFASHYSAMVLHGLTDRFPRSAFISTVPQAVWTDYRNTTMTRDLGAMRAQYESAKLPLLRRLRAHPIERALPIDYLLCTLPTSTTPMRDGRIRASRIGRVFLEMLQRPDLCGGIEHVIDCFRTNATPYLDIIIHELDQHGSPIDKVRAGYLLENIAHLQDTRLDTWTNFAARGGSRKLDGAGEYAGRHSERWQLSLNVQGLSETTP